jgi:outer membrane murein-binding lipoprotein Lpp
MPPNVWAVIGPIMAILGAVVGVAVGWGAMRVIIADLKVEVGKLSALSSAVVGLELRTAHMAEDIATLQSDVQIAKLDIARLQERERYNTGRFPAVPQESKT